jgi:hypothetical protein
VLPFLVDKSISLSTSIPRHGVFRTAGKGAEVHADVEEVHREVKQEVDQDVKQDVEEYMQQHITGVLCKGRADGGIWGGAQGEAQEKESKVKKKRFFETVNKAGARNVAGRAYASTTAKETRASSAAGRASASTIAKEARAINAAPGRASQLNVALQVEHLRTQSRKAPRRKCKLATATHGHAAVTEQLLAVR